MEVENEKEETHEINKNTSNSSSLQNLTDTQLKYLSQILGIKISHDEISLFANIEDLASFINSIKFPDKKKNETRDYLIEILHSFNSEESSKKISEEKSKNFNDCVKKNGKTIIYTTAEEDELSPTMKAFYFCDKSKQILSDKDSGEFKKNFESAYPNPFMKDINEDNSSYNSGFIEKAPVHNVTKVLSKKRKISSNINNPKSNKKKKVEKTKEESNNSINDDDLQESEYCIPECKYGRKSRNQAMIQCDNCSSWYHKNCLDISDEYFQKYNGNGKAWFCHRCEESSLDSKKNSEE